jgi:hypothetical protein
MVFIGALHHKDKKSQGALEAIFPEKFKKTGETLENATQSVIK